MKDALLEPFAQYVSLFPELSQYDEFLPFIKALEQKTRDLGVSLRRSKKNTHEPLPFVNIVEAWARALEANATGEIPHLSFKRGVTTSKTAASGALCAVEIRHGATAAWRISGLDAKGKPLSIEDLHLLAKKVPQTLGYGTPSDLAIALRERIPDQFVRPHSEHRSEAFQGALFVEIANAQLRKLEEEYGRMPPGRPKEHQFGEIRRVRTLLSDAYDRYNAANDSIAKEALQVVRKKLATYEIPALSSEQGELTAETRTSKGIGEVRPAEKG